MTESVTKKFCFACQQERDADSFVKVGKVFKCGYCAERSRMAQKASANERDAFGKKVTEQNKRINKERADRRREILE